MTGYDHMTCLWKRKRRPNLVPGVVLVAAMGLGLILAPGARAEDDPYPHGDFEDDCSKCHSSQGWHPVVISDRFDHGRSSDFALEGAHESTMCRSCHLSLEFSEADPKCVTCHLDVHNGELGMDCAQCHSTANFINRADEVRSHRTTRFPLNGAHTTLDCLACHPMQPSGGLRFVNTRTECEACHLEAFSRTTEPNHVALEFDQDCAACHGTTTWNAVRFDQFDHTATGFPLAGAHRGLDCAQCHVSGGFSSVGTDCLTCHRQDYESTRTPDHLAGGFPTDCQQCHGSQTWSSAEFDHGQTGFALTGSHGGLTCERCHTSGTQAAIDATCISCHRTDYDGAPNHVSSNFQLTCEECHNTVVWSNAVFNHDFFPFVGGHSGLGCDQCHTSGTFGTIPADCISCHQETLQTAPGHVTSGFSQNCEECHGATTWVDWSFDHGFFPLSGAHNVVQCLACHTSGTYGTIPVDCFSCHDNDYQQAPGHAGAFPTTCEDCHTVTTWQNATFDHSFFALHGGHNGLQCVACHTSGVYATIPADCFSCHQSDYTGAPDHQTLNFPHDCESCHDTSNWQNTNFFHSFPLSGPHGGNDCSECHISGTTEEFSCYGTCHEHSQSKMNDKHSEESGYAYDFQLCLSCHPDGRD